MLYNCENTVIKIVDIGYLKWKGGFFNVKPRDVSALSFRIKGTAQIVCGEKNFTVNTNDILYIPQGAGYTADYTDTEMMVFHFITENDDKNAELYSLENNEEIYKAFMNAHMLWKSKKQGYTAYALSSFYKILGMIHEAETRSSMPEHFLNAVSFINSNFRNSNMTIPEICAASGISETVFREQFKKHYQKTPIEYINDMKLEYARTLISYGMPIEQAALESGFNDPKYFSRLVRKRFGCTARELRYYGR